MRLVDADELLEKVYTIENGGIYGDCEVVDRCEIENAPTIEYSKNSLDYDYGFAEGLRRAREKKGKWIKQENKKTEFFCSECGRMIDTKPFTRTDNFPFCHCGADMREEADND